MAKKLKTKLYDLSRASGKCASTLNDIDDIMSLRFGKLIKRKCKRKTMSKVNRIINKIYK